MMMNCPLYSNTLTPALKKKKQKKFQPRVRESTPSGSIMTGIPLKNRFAVSSSKENRTSSTSYSLLEKFSPRKWTHKVRNLPPDILIVHGGSINGMQHFCSKNTGVISCSHDMLKDISENIQTIISNNQNRKKIVINI